MSANSRRFRTSSLLDRLPFVGLAVGSRRGALASLLTIAALAVTGCAESAEPDVSPAAAAAAGSAAAGSATAGNATAGGSATAGATASINLSPDQNRVSTEKVDAIADLLPQAIRDRGSIVVTGSSGSAPPLRFYADDDTTVIGSEVDLAYLFADVLGLKVEIGAADWAQNFVQIDSGKADVFISNVTVTEERKEKYDFATYRNDVLAFEAKAGAGFKISDAKDAAGKIIGVSSGTNQEKILVDWSAEDVKNGLAPIDIKYFQNSADYYLALSSGRIDAYFGPNPTAAYHVATAGQSEIVGTQSGAGPKLQGEIAVLTKKGNGLAPAFAAAINHTIENGTYAKVLEHWNLSNEAVSQSRVNPPGLPKTG